MTIPNDKIGVTRFYSPETPRRDAIAEAIDETVDLFDVDESDIVDIDLAATIGGEWKVKVAATIKEYDD